MTDKRKPGRPASSSYPGPNSGVSRATWYRTRRKDISLRIKKIDRHNMSVDIVSMKDDINELTRHRDALLVELVRLREIISRLSPKRRPFRCLQEKVM